MKHVTLSLSQGENKQYDIVIGSDLLRTIGEHISLDRYSSIFVITDEKLQSLFLGKLLSGLPKTTSYIVLSAGENAKNIQSIEQIWTEMKKAQCDRKTLVITLGGGVIGDIGGFAASTYMRGVALLHIPTTLLSQIDASIGGKTAIDFLGIKNLIGTFHQPVGVIIDTMTLQTLPKREFLAGFAEMIKHGLIKDRNYIDALLKKIPMDFSQEELVALITRSCEIKAEIIQSDEIEHGERKLLNFGHTIGHGIEALSLETASPLLHGEAISLGIVAEARLSQLMGLLSKGEETMIISSLEKVGLPVKIVGMQQKAILEKMRSDKKNEKGKMNFTLLTEIGKAIYNQQVSDENLLQAIAFIIT